MFTLAQNPPPPAKTACTSDDIARKDVTNCDCPANFPPKDSKTCLSPNPQICTLSYKTCGIKPPPANPLLSKAPLIHCGAGCIDENNDCSGCYIWFVELCTCLQRLIGQQTTTCEVFGGTPLAIGQRSPPSWVLNYGNELITSTYKIPGILELHDIPDPNGGFAFGQDQLQKFKGFGTLSLNPTDSRSQEQIHIHLHNNPKGSKLRDALSSLKLTDYAKLSEVPLATLPNVDQSLTRFGSMFCRVASASGIIYMDQAADILGYLANLPPDGCERYKTGAGYMIDSRGYAWSCITTARAAEEAFSYS
jgi:hypothetical protein